MPVRCITFDLDDTLWFVAPVIQRAESRFYFWLQERYPRISERYAPQDLLEHRKVFMRERPELHHDLTRLRKQWLALLAADRGYDHELVEPGFQVYWEARNEVEVFDEAREMLAHLQHDFVLGAITNGNADVRRIGIADYFRFVIRSEEVGTAKPHPEIFEAALRAAGVTAAEAVHVGDDPERDIAGAAAAGMRTVWVNLRDEAWPLESVVPTATVRSLDEVAPLLRAWAAH